VTRKMGLSGAVALLSIGVAVAASTANAGRVYQFSGKVAAMSGEAISLKSGSEVLEFRKDTLGNSQRDFQRVKVGDQITIWYTLDAQKVKVQGAPQQPGQVAPKAKPDLENGEKKGIIQDDRAFYDARNDVAGQRHVPPHG
jgi:hypothetical protein